jgi:hypothetical protein
MAALRVAGLWSSIGGNLIFASSQFFFGDASNQNPKLPDYWVVDLHSSYQLTHNVKLFASFKTCPTATTRPSGFSAM